MDVDRVPHTVVLGVTASSAKAAMLLDNNILLPGRRFTHWEPIRHTVRSGRVLYQKPCMSAVPIHRPFKGIDVMEAFAMLGNHARYHPAAYPGRRKGWSIEKVVIDGMPAAIVWCEWAEIEPGP